MNLRHPFLSLAIIAIIAFVIYGCTGDSPVSTITDNTHPAGWQVQHPTPTQHSLYSVFFVDEKHGWAVGGGGTALRSFDGGRTWKHVDIPFEGSLSNLQFVNKDEGWMVVDESGYPNRILHTSDGGSTWKVQVASPSRWIKDIHFTDNRHGWAVGWDSLLLRTADGGETWEHLQNPPLAYCQYRFESVFFVDSLYGWIGGCGDSILRTYDGGQTWEKRYSPRDIDYLQFRSDTLGWAYEAFSGHVMRCQGNARYWVVKSNVGTTIGGMQFIDDYNGWAVGAKGRVSRSVDGGFNWVVHETDTDDYLFDVFFINTTHGWAVGERGRIIYTTDGGDTWNSASSPLTDLFDVDFVSNRTGWAVGHNGMIVNTTNAGESWQIQESGISDVDLQAVKFWDDQTGWVVGDEGTILKTPNGGLTWQDRSHDFPAVLYDVDFIDERTGWVVGSHSTVLHTTDAGETWTPLSVPVEAYVFVGVDFINSGFGAVAGYRHSHDEVVLTTTDGGLTWETSLIDLDTYSLTDIQIIDDTTIFAIGDWATLLRSYDRGQTWTYEILHEACGTVAVTLESIHFADSRRGWIVGELWYDRGARILYTEDGGETWSAQITGVQRGLQSVSSANRNAAWIVGRNGLILHTNTGGHE